MHARLRAVALFAATLMLAAACGDAPDDTASPEPTDTGSASPTASESEPQAVDFTGCMVTDEGGVDDRSFNQTAWEGMLRAEDELGITAKVLESSSSADYEPNIAAFIEEDCDLIVTAGFALGEATRAAAEANPDQDFAIVDFAYEDGGPENVRQLIYATDQAAFLAGYVAAGVTQSGQVGTYGGRPFPTVTIFMDGLYAGVQYYNEQNGGDVAVLGWDPASPDSGSFTGDFENEDNGRRTTETFLQNGADIIMPVAGPVGNGTVAAVEESGGENYVIWVDTDGCTTLPDSCGVFLTSVLKNMDVSVFDTIQTALEGTFEGGLFEGTLENDGVGLAEFHENEDAVPDDVKTALEEIRQGIIDGSIEVSPTA